MTALRISPFAPECIPALLELHAANTASYPPGDQHRYFESLLEIKGVFLCLYEDETLIAAGGIMKHEDYWWLHSLDVLPSRQRQGWGRRLISALLVSIDTGDKEFFTVALNAATGAENFYRRLGFAPYDPGYTSTEVHFCRHFSAAALQSF